MAISLINTTSITKKVTMGIAGFFLMSFLVVHLGINLLMLKGDNGAAFSKAVQIMSDSLFIKLFEYVLFAAIIIHVAIGIVLKLQNLRSRPVRYRVPTKSESSFFSRYMIWTGLIILTFLAIHFMHFYFVKLGIVAKPSVAADTHDFYPIAVALFQTPAYFWLYIILMAPLGFHLYHAFQSFFQTIGFQHNRYFGLIKLIGVVYAIVITLGFLIIPVFFMFFYH